MATFGDVTYEQPVDGGATPPEQQAASGEPEIDINDPRLTSENIEIDPEGDAYAMPPVLPDGKWRVKLKSRDVGKAPKTAKYLPKLDRNNRPYLYTALEAEVIDHSGKFDGIGLTDYFVSTMVRRDGTSASATILHKLGKPSGRNTTHGQLMKDLITSLAGEPELGVETQWEAECRACQELAKGRKDFRSVVKKGMHNFPQEKNAKGEVVYTPRLRCMAIDPVSGKPLNHGDMFARPQINRYLALAELK